MSEDLLIVNHKKRPAPTIHRAAAEHRWRWDVITRFPGSPEVVAAFRAQERMRAELGLVASFVLCPKPECFGESS